jgi:hypothetical protein
MDLVEYYRIRKTFVWWVCIGVLVWASTLGLIHITTISIDGHESQGATKLAQLTLNLSLFTVIPLFASLAFATGVGTSLNREHETAALSWTKPQRRSLSAIQLFLVDLGGIGIFYLISWAFIVLALIMFRARPAVDADFPTMLLLTLGIPVMWYGLAQAATGGAPIAGRGIVAGFLWPVALGLSVLRWIGGPIGNVLHVLNVINPLAYFSSLRTTPHGVVVSAFWMYDIQSRVLVVWLLAIALLGVTTFVWTRREA